MDGDLIARFQVLPGFHVGDIQLVNPLPNPLEDAIRNPGWLSAKANEANGPGDPLYAGNTDLVQIGMHKHVTRKIRLYLPGART